MALWLLADCFTPVKAASGPRKVSAMDEISYAKDDDYIYLVHDSGLALMSKKISVGNFIATAVAGNTNLNIILSIETNTQFTTVFYITNLYVNEEYISNFFTTNVLVDASVSNFFVTNYFGPWYYNYISNHYFTANYFNEYQSFYSNYWQTNILINEYVSNYYSTNIFQDIAITTNIYYTLNSTTNLTLNTLTVYTNANINRLYVTNLYVLGGATLTSTWEGGPTGKLNAALSDQYFTSPSACEVTGLTNMTAGLAHSIQLTLSNSAATNWNLTLPADIVRKGRDTSALVVTSGTERVIWFKARSEIRTNEIDQSF